MAAVADIKREWSAFKHDAAGHRFQNQRTRMQNGSRKLMYLQVTLGVLLLAGGVVLLFIPGPGLLFIVFGLALVAGISAPLARALDRLEPPVRRRVDRAKAWWHEASRATQVTLMALAAIAGLAAVWGMYRLWFG